MEASGTSNTVDERSLPPGGPYDLSIVMPAYNEEEGVGVTVTHLFQAFTKAGIRLELVAVDNGSADRTGEVLRALQPTWPGLVIHRVHPNEGYGNGKREPRREHGGAGEVQTLAPRTSPPALFRTPPAPGSTSCR